jgi:hypothetical protein
MFTNWKSRPDTRDMNTKLKALGRAAAALAFLFCLAGGIWILKTTAGKSHGDDAVWTGIGLYFIGKAFFVGPMLLIAAEQLGSGRGEIESQGK